MVARHKGAELWLYCELALVTLTLANVINVNVSLLSLAMLGS